MFRHLCCAILMAGLAVIPAYSFEGTAADMQGTPESAGIPCPVPRMQQAQPPRGDILMRLELSEQQQQQIADIRTQEQEKNRELFAKLEQARGSFMKEETVASFNEKNLREAAQKVTGMETELMLVRAKANYDIKQVLTAEQKEKLLNIILAAPQPPAGPDKQGQKTPPSHPKQP